jgi:hypothetical protein
MAKAAKTGKPATDKTTPASQPKASVPAPRGGGDPMAALMNLANQGKKATTKAKKPERAVLQLTESAEENFRKWVPAKILADHFRTHLENIVAALDEEVFPLFAKAMWEAKSKPQNPALKSRNENNQPDIEGQYVVQEKFSISAPDTSDGSDPREAMVTVLVGIGLSEANARRLVETELDFMPQVTINLSELLNGKKDGKQWREPTDDERSAAAKLLAYINNGTADPLTDDERASLTVTRFNKVTFKTSGFLERVTTYCTTYDQLLKLLTLVFKPIVSHRGAKFGVSDPLDTKNSRLIQEAANILGVALGADNGGGDDDSGEDE